MPTEAAPLVKPTTKEEPTDCMSRVAFGRFTWSHVLTIAGAVVMLVIAVVTWTSCSGIPALPYFMLLYCLVSAASPVLALYKPEAATLLHATPSTITSAGDVLGLLQIGLAIWGAILTLPKVGDYIASFSGSDSLGCSDTLYSSGLVCAVATIVIASAVIVPMVSKAMGKGAAAEPTDDVKAEP